MLNFRGNARLMVREPTDVLFHSRLMTPQPRVQAGGNPASIPVVVRSFDREGESSVVSAFGERLAAEVCEPGVRPGPVRILSKFGNLERLRPGRLSCAPGDCLDSILCVASFATAHGESIYGGHSVCLFGPRLWPSDNCPISQPGVTSE